MTPRQVEAAGGVVLRPGEEGYELCVVHRPRYGDWTLPKGKLEPDETFEEAALREVEEETGLRCELGRELASTHYIDGNGRPKIVRYWLMRPAKGELHPADEVDDARWLPLEDAFDLLSYERDRDVLRSLREI